MENKNVTIDDLAVMVQKGFDGMDKKIDNGFNSVNIRLDRIENILIKQQNERIEMLEKRMQKIEEALAVK